MNVEDFKNCICLNPDFKFSPIYGVYINSTATLVAAPDGRGNPGNRKWRFTKIYVDEYTGFRFIRFQKAQISLAKIFKNAWGLGAQLPPLKTPPVYRDKYNERRRLKKNGEF